MSASQTKNEIKSFLKNALRDKFSTSSETEKASDGGKDIKNIINAKDAKNTNYFHSLKVEEPEPAEEYEPDDEQQQEQETVEAPKPITPVVIEPIAISKAKKRRIRRARVAERESESSGAQSVTSSSSTDDTDQSTYAGTEPTRTKHPKSTSTARSAYNNSDSDSGDNISDLDLDDSPPTSQDSTIPPAATPPQSTDDDDDDDDKILDQAIQKKKITLAEAEHTPRTINLTDDIALFGGYICLVLACCAQYGLSEISIAQVLLLVGTIGVCVPLDWVGELGGVGENELMTEPFEDDEVRGKMDSAMLAGMRRKGCALGRKHGVGYGWLCLVLMGWVMRVMDLSSMPVWWVFGSAVGLIGWVSGSMSVVW